MTINQISNNNNDNDNDNAGHCRSCYVNSFCCPCATPLENARIGSIRYPWLSEKCFFKGNMFRDCMKSFKWSSQTLLYKEELMVGRSSIYHTTTLEAASICIYRTTIFKSFFFFFFRAPFHLSFEAHTTHDASWLNRFEPPGTVGSWEAILWVASRAGNPLSVLPRTWGVVKQRPFF